MSTQSGEFRGMTGGILDEVVELILDGIAKADRRQYSDSEQLLEKAATLDPGIALSWYNLGVVQTEKGDNIKAKEAFEKALALPDGKLMPEAWINLAFAKLLEGDLKGAEQSVNSGLEANPENADLWHALGVLNMSVDNLEEAEKAFNSAVSFDPQHESSWINLACIYRKSGRRDEASKALDKGYSGKMFRSMQDLEKQYQATKDILAMDGFGFAVDSMPDTYKESMMNETSTGAILLRRMYISPLKFTEVKKLAQKTGRPDHWMRVALWALDRKQPDTAEAALREVLEIDSSYPYAWFHLGNLLTRKQQYREAYDAFNQEVTLRDENASAWNNIATLLLGADLGISNTTELAVAASEKATRNAPGLAEAWMNLAFSLRRMGRSNEALSALGKGLKLKPELQEVVNRVTGRKSDIPSNVLGMAMSVVLERFYPPEEAKELFNSANTLREAGKHQEAIEDYEKCVEISPRFAEAWYNMGLSYTHLRDFSKAIEMFKKSTEADPSIAKVWNTMGGFLLQEKRRDEAVSAFRKAIEADYDHKNAWNNLGYVYSRENDYAEAEKAYRRVTELDPSNHEAWYMLGQMALGQDKYQIAEEAYKAATDVKPDFAYAYGGRGQVYLEQDRLEEAEAMMRKVLELKPGDPGGKRGLEMVLERKRTGRPSDPTKLFYYGVEMAKERKFDEAKTAFIELKKLMPSHFLWKFGLAYVHFELGEYEDCIPLFEEVATQEPSFYQAHLGLGEAKAKLGRWQEGREHIMHVVQSHPDKPDVQDSMGLVLSESPSPEDAEPYFRRAIELKSDFASYWRNLGDLLEKLGRTDEAQEAYEKANKLKT
jgi:tetratricopeptide (TPR) repeat protein